MQHTHTRLTAPFPGLPGWTGTRKVKPIWILLKQETVSGSAISWAICNSAPCSRQITTPAPNHSVFYRPDALPAAQPTASKHWRPVNCKCKYRNKSNIISIQQRQLWSSSRWQRLCPRHIYARQSEAACCWRPSWQSSGSDVTSWHQGRHRVTTTLTTTTAVDFHTASWPHCLADCHCRHWSELTKPPNNHWTAGQLQTHTATCTGYLFISK